MINVNTDIIEYTEEGVRYILKEYIITSTHQNSIVKIVMDKLRNQIFTDEDGTATITTSNTKEHTLKITIGDETITETL